MKAAGQALVRSGLPKVNSEEKETLNTVRSINSFSDSVENSEELEFGQDRKWRCKFRDMSNTSGCGGWGNKTKMPQELGKRCQRHGRTSWECVRMHIGHPGERLPGRTQLWFKGRGSIRGECWTSAVPLLHT